MIGFTLGKIIPDLEGLWRLNNLSPEAPFIDFKSF